MLSPRWGKGQKATNAWPVFWRKLSIHALNGRLEMLAQTDFVGFHLHRESWYQTWSHSIDAEVWCSECDAVNLWHWCICFSAESITHLLELFSRRWSFTPPSQYSNTGLSHAVLSCSRFQTNVGPRTIVCNCTISGQTCIAKRYCERPTRVLMQDHHRVAIFGNQAVVVFLLSMSVIAMLSPSVCASKK